MESSARAVMGTKIKPEIGTSIGPFIESVMVQRSFEKNVENSDY